MSWQAELLRVRSEKENAKKRLNQLLSEEFRLLVMNAPCSLCQQSGGGRGDVGVPCRKNGHGQVTFPHAERRRAATALVTAEALKKMGKK